MKKCFTKTIKDLVAMDGKLTTLANNIKLNTNKQVEASTKLLTSHTIHIANDIRSLVQEFQQSNQHTQYIIQNLLIMEIHQLNSSQLLQGPSNFIHTMHTIGHASQLQAPSGFQCRTHHTLQQPYTKPTTFLMNSFSLASSIWATILLVCILCSIISKDYKLMLWIFYSIPKYHKLIHQISNNPTLDPHILIHHFSPIISITLHTKLPLNQKNIPRK